MRKDILIIPILLAFYWLASLYLHPQSVVGPDEPGYFDPAASWHLGQGFTSGAWYAQTDNEFFAGNLPLHHILLKYWFDVFGFSPLSARTFSFSLVSLAFCLFWIALRRLNWMNSCWLTIASGCVLLSESTYYVSLSGRPDAITVLLASATLLAFTLPISCIAGALLFLCGFLSALAGLQLAAASAFILLLALVLTKWKLLDQVVAFALGGIVGGVSLLVVYDSNGVLPAFVASVLPNTSAGNFSIYRYTGFWLDRSLLLIWLAGIGILILSFFLRKGDSKQLRTAVAAGLLLFGLPLFLLVLGKFSSSYTWMPIWAGVPVMAWWGMQVRTVQHEKLITSSLALALCAAAALGGYPRITLKYLFDPMPSSFQAMENLACKYIKPDDVVVYSSSAFYAVKPRAKRCFYANWYPKAMSDKDKRAANKAIIDTKRAEELKEQFGEKWNPVGEPDKVIVGRFLRAPLIDYIQTYERVSPVVDQGELQ